MENSEKLPIGKKMFNKLALNNIRTSKKYTKTSIKHIGFGVILIQIYETFPIGLGRQV